MNQPINDFNPKRQHPLYFIRKGLFQAIEDNKHHLSGVMLDFGCGSKPYKDLIKVDQYIGLDYQTDDHTIEHDEVDVFYDGVRIPFPNNHFDSVLSSEVFEHLFELDKLLGELHRVLKPNGKMLITCPFVWAEHLVPFDYARYTRFGLEHLLKKHGFKVIVFEKKGSFIETIFQLNNLYHQNLLSNGGLFKNIPIVRSLSWRILKTFPYLNNSLGVMLNSMLPQNDDFYLSNILVVEKVEV